MHFLATLQVAESIWSCHRWSALPADHRKAANLFPHPGGVPEFLSLASDGTRGFHAFSGNPSGCRIHLVVSPVVCATRRPPESCESFSAPRRGARIPFSCIRWNQRVPCIFWQPSRLLNPFGRVTGGLCYAPTTGYYLSALQAGNRALSLLLITQHSVLLEQRGFCYALRRFSL